jgi:hypothetical protein
LRKAIGLLVNYDQLARMLFKEEAAEAKRMLEQVELMLHNKLDLSGRGSKGEYTRVNAVERRTDDLPAGKIRKGLLATIATQEEIEELLALYNSHFEAIKSAYDIDGAEEGGELAADEEMNEALGDVGTEEETKKSAEDLAAVLGFPDLRPIEFNKVKFKYSTLDLWEPEHLQIEGQKEDVALVWAQLAGVSAMVRKTFYEKVRETVAPGVLLADVMGMGKSALVMSYMAFVMQVYMAAQNEVQGPPILCE